jgi:inosose dehydratase
MKTLGSDLATTTAARTAEFDHSRRAFIRNTTTFAIGIAIAPTVLQGAQEKPAATTQSTLVGSNIYGWGQYAARDKKKLDVDEVISALRDAGYDYLESFMDLSNPEENARFAEKLKAKGLQPVSLYTGARIHEAGKAGESVAKILTAAKLCKDAGFQVISCNPDPIGREKTDEELKTQVAALTELGEGLNALGMSLGVHHHLPEMASNAREFHYVFRNTKPSVVRFCYDVHWVWKGGIGPEAALKDYGDRVVTWHLRQSRGGTWFETLDHGDIDYTLVARIARERSLPRRFTVELAIEDGTSITRSAVENHRRSQEFVRRVFQNA